jgi:hypothetical protein
MSKHLGADFLYRCSSFESLIVNEIFVKSWWLILFFLICLFFYIQKQEQRHSDLNYLTQKQQAILEKKEFLLEEQQELVHRLKSINEFQYREFVLIETLGVIPEGSTKFYVKESP